MYLPRRGHLTLTWRSRRQQVWERRLSSCFAWTGSPSRRGVANSMLDTIRRLRLIPSCSVSEKSGEASEDVGGCGLRCLRRRITLERDVHPPSRSPKEAGGQRSPCLTAHRRPSSCAAGAGSVTDDTGCDPPRPDFGVVRRAVRARHLSPSASPVPAPRPSAPARGL